MEKLRLSKRSISTIKKAVDSALEHIPMTVSASDISPGRKIFFPIPMKKIPQDMTDFLYLYVESKLPSPPKNKTLGFTDEDVVDEVGIYMFTKNDKSVRGSTYSLDVLLKQVIIDTSLHNRVMYRVNEMQSMIHLDESFLDTANLEMLCNRSEGFWSTRH